MNVTDELFGPVVRARLERQQRYQLEPWAIRPILRRPVPVRLLLVTDAGGSFGDDDFGLSALIETLTTPTVPWVRFSVTTANRRADATADLPGFRFDGHDLDPYDQMWLFGVERSNGLELSESELRAISVYMDAGGGVFATGDHEDLGVALCGRIPRVRSMRKWHWPDPGPNGEPVAPPVGGPNRYDTLRRGNDPGIQFDDQSDDVPQRITPKLYSTWNWNPWVHRSYPHPLLCGPRGVIRVLPDHPHEGECYEPADLGASFRFEDHTIEEYPGGLGPEVVAWSQVQGRLVDENKGPLNARRFGAIGAYDEHRAARGRVVVDATWHHFFNVNLIGTLGANPDPIKAVGFDATASGQVVYDDIQAYQRNIAVWLCRPATLTAMWWRALWWLRWNHVLLMDTRPPYLESADRLDIGELLRIGREARDVLGRVASQCTVVRWVLADLLRPRLPDVLGPILDPWQPNPPIPDPPPVAAAEPPNFVLPLHGEMLLDAGLGAAVYALASAFPLPDDENLSRADDADWDRIVAAHVDVAVRLVADHVGSTAEELARFGRLLG